MRNDDYFWDMHRKTLVEFEKRWVSLRYMLKPWETTFTMKQSKNLLNCSEQYAWENGTPKYPF